MSVYYNLACDVHKQQIPLWGMGAGCCGTLPTATKDPHTVSMFILEHLRCPITLIDENDRRAIEYEDMLDDEGNPIPKAAQ